MIPKVIHYCWFGGKPLPPLAERCIASWKKYLPNYEIKRWDESNFDVNIIPYTAEAYEAKKYAFVSDYARFWILYNYGGIYFDTDVEVIKPLDAIISAGPFMGCERPYKADSTPDKLWVNPGLGLGSIPGLSLYKELLDFYAELNFMNQNGTLNTTTVVTYTTEMLCRHGLQNTPEIQNVEGVNIYPVDYFCPIDTETWKMKATKRTVSIHHYSSSWTSGYKRLIYRIKKMLRRLTWI